MNGFDMETLIAIKSSFQANEFQWIKTSDQTKAGKVVTVRDVVPSRNGRFAAILSDGSQIDTDEVSSNLMMITDDQQPLSMTEIRSINYIPSLTNQQNASPDIPEEYSSFITPVPPVKPATPPIAQVVEVDPSDLFGMFSLEDTDLNLSIKIKLPSKPLLKMMYTNSKNKDEFLTKLSNYINSSVTVDSIKKTMKKIFSTTPKSKVTRPNE